ncbi:UTP-glucose-1-phosphate uridylyltransferase GalU [Methanoregula boonei 6A8]|jgi:UTP--glucose-1-phosphate uridylyltransferase|uniref:UTP--glucose-1-phosphate uridylyltransferase n=1 Tax=Methanoregula boonei (strain DSM 21154 / JCM 14090 / 6A8) TaxID=456442 RepID=A7I970_METB6|nr:UTP--glucose-1-phosphate uridylyltransferase GalU [Methanoregula boonei]ABS56281.1 UTP-glucose-1-phosphate uridylyltransferase GalU [Methanoregula boonei 6A8]
MKGGQHVRKAVIPAAGLGTRFLPITKAQPKEMLPVVDKPVIQYVVEEAIQSGIDDILIITGRNKRAIEDHFDRCFELEVKFSHRKKDPFTESLQALADFPDLHFIRQREQKGLGDAVNLAGRHCDNEPFAVLLGDTICISPAKEKPCTRQMMDAFERHRRSIIAVEPVAGNKIQDYGIIDGREIEKGVYEIDDIVEKPAPEHAPSNLGAIGRYVLTPEIFFLLADATPGVGGEIQLTDALRRLDRPLGLVTNCRRYDIGDKLGWMKSSIELTLEREEFAGEIRPFLSKLLKGEGS